MTVLRFDVVVLGAGSAGCIAALAAAKHGTAVALIDRLPFPGGTSTAVLDTFYAFHAAGKNGRKVVGGLPDLPLEQLAARDKVRPRPNSFGSGLGYTYDPETLKIVWASLLREAGVSVILHSTCIDAAVRPDGTVSSVTVAGKFGLATIEAWSFVDASGDADLVARAGGSFLDDDDHQQPATLTFRVSGIDVDRFTAEGRPGFRDAVQRGREEGLVLRGDGGSLHLSAATGVVLTALTRVSPPTLDDPLDAGRAEMDGLLQIDDWMSLLRHHVPGCEGAELVAIAATLGIRETRRVLGVEVLTETDVVDGVLRDDQIALCGAPIEDLSDDSTRWQHVGGTGVYGIPWGCLVPVGLENVAVAGRCLSATHDAHASARSMATCMAMGQAAGTAAAIASSESKNIVEVEIGELRAALREAGAVVEELVR